MANLLLTDGRVATVNARPGEAAKTLHRALEQNRAIECEGPTVTWFVNPYCVVTIEP